MRQSLSEGLGLRVPVCTKIWGANAIKATLYLGHFKTIGVGMALKSTI